MANKELKAIAINKRFSSYTVEEQNDMLNNYTVIIRDFNRKPPDKIDDYNEYKKCFKYIKRMDRIMYLHGVLLRLTAKEHFWIRILLRERSVDEEEFISVTFRPNKCKNPKCKKKEDIKKSIADFKRRFWKQISEYSKNNKCYFSDSENPKEIFKKAFKQLICYKVEGPYKAIGFDYRLETEYPSL